MAYIIQNSCNSRHSRRVPNTSKGLMTRWSFPAWFVHVWVSRMKRHSAEFETAEEAIGHSNPRCQFSYQFLSRCYRRASSQPPTISDRDRRLCSEWGGHAFRGNPSKSTDLTRTLTWNGTYQRHSFAFPRFQLHSVDCVMSRADT
jgi:hypothetical protein